MTKVTQQKGVSSSTPSALKRWLISKIMTYLGSEKYLRKERRKRESKRVNEGRKHVVEYFHQVDDGYSHLAIQVLNRIKARYDVELVIHLVPSLRDDNSPEPDMLLKMSRADAAAIAPYYQLSFPAKHVQPQQELSATAAAILCRLDNQAFCTTGIEVSECLWQGNQTGLTALAQQNGMALKQEVRERLIAGNARRAELKHYSGAMFWYEGEWYWGVDRLYHLEQRLTSLGAVKGKDLPEVAPRPQIVSDYGAAAQDMTLEYYPSLRSPYTAVSWSPTMQLVADSGIRLNVMPLLPMVMRGVPATMPKAKYIVTDAAREARAMGVDYGQFYDPIGKPVMQGYSLYMWALAKGEGNALLAAFLSCAFSHGVNTNSLKGMRKVVETAGLDWSQAKQHLSDNSWQETLESNRKRMYGFGSWGVPSYRLLDADGNEVISAWGQDRLWLVSKKIQESVAVR